MAEQNFSQNQEQHVIMQYFRGTKNGRFLDIGAFDGVRFSNTRALALYLGWGGILVEPHPAHAQKCRTLYAQNAKIKTVEVALGVDADCEAPMFANDTYYSTIKQEETQRWKNTPSIKFDKNQINVKCLTFQSFFNEHMKPPFDTIDFVSIDAEGVDVIILKQIAFYLDALKVKMVCVEHNGKVLQECKKILADVGFTKILLINGENLICVRD